MASYLTITLMMTTASSVANAAVSGEKHLHLVEVGGLG